jgi:hypothetical protein
MRATTQIVYTRLCGITTSFSYFAYMANPKPTLKPTNPAYTLASERKSLDATILILPHRYTTGTWAGHLTPTRSVSHVAYTYKWPQWA